MQLDVHILLHYLLTQQVWENNLVDMCFWNVSIGSIGDCVKLAVNKMRSDDLGIFLAINMKNLFIFQHPYHNLNVKVACH